MNCYNPEFEFDKPAEATLDYTFDWTRTLKGGIIIESSDITVDVDGDIVPSITVVDFSFTDKKVTVLISGGIEGEVYNINCIIETDPKDIIDIRTIILTIV